MYNRPALRQPCALRPAHSAERALFLLRHVRELSPQCRVVPSPHAATAARSTASPIGAQVLVSAQCSCTDQTQDFHFPDNWRGKSCCSPSFSRDPESKPGGAGCYLDGPRRAFRAKPARLRRQVGPPWGRCAAPDPPCQAGPGCRNPRVGSFSPSPLHRKFLNTDNSVSSLIRGSSRAALG